MPLLLPEGEVVPGRGAGNVGMDRHPGAGEDYGEAAPDDIPLGAPAVWMIHGWRASVDGRYGNAGRGAPEGE